MARLIESDGMGNGLARELLRHRTFGLGRWLPPMHDDAACRVDRHVLDVQAVGGEECGQAVVGLRDSARGCDVGGRWVRLGFHCHGLQVAVSW